MGRKEDVGGRGEETKLRKEVMEGLGREVGLIVRSLLPLPRFSSLSPSLTDRLETMVREISSRFSEVAMLLSVEALYSPVAQSGLGACWGIF